MFLSSRIVFGMAGIFFHRNATDFNPDCSDLLISGRDVDVMTIVFGFFEFCVFLSISQQY